jgi:hypothetical protein
LPTQIFDADLLLKALEAAHGFEVINYKPRKNDKGYMVDTLESVCMAVYEAKERFEISTKDQLAEAMQEELMKELKGIY